MSIALTRAVFFGSGLAALLYQVVWQRLLAIFSGADVYSATIIVAAYMAGLGIGSLAGGQVADRVSRRASLVLFAAAEAAVGLFGAFSGWFYYDVLYTHLGQLGLDRAAVGGVLFISLLWPTFFMGASLPLLARAITHRVELAAASIGALYGFNAMGAACGALVGTWMLLPAIGLGDSLRVGAAVNLACAVIVLPLAWRWGGAEMAVDAAAEAAPAAPSAHTRAPQAGTWVWGVAYGVAGFVALSYEIVWFRVLGVIAKSSAFTFGTLLAIYLIGIGAGAVVGSRWAVRRRHPGRDFFAVQALAGAGAGLLLLVLFAVADDIRALSGYLAEYEPLDVRASMQRLRSLETPANFLRFYVLLPVALVLPPTLLMGAAFPLIQRVVQRDDRAIGRRVALVVGANIVGSIAGSVVTGMGLLRWLGTAGTIRVLLASSAVFAWAALRPHGRILAGTGAATALGLSLAVPAGPVFWARLHGAAPSQIAMAEDDTGLALIRAEAGDRAIFFANGMGQSVLPYGDIHTALGALPVLAHPAPRDVVIIGLGSGDTAYAASSRAATSSITCIEIVRSQLPTLRAWADRGGYGGLVGLLGDRRVHHVVGDGRAFLSASRDRFDVIEADALRPTSAFSGTLYSQEYFALVKDRLKSGGLAITWAPTRRVHDGFVRVFPYVASLPGLLVGSADPFRLDRDLILARANAPDVRAHFARAHVDIAELLARYFEHPPVRLEPDGDRTAFTDVNTDLFPRDEFDLSPP
jgi:predicted membrane-bound spermidine synthase